MTRLLATVILSNVIGNLLLSIGVKRDALTWLLAGIAVLIFWTISRMALLSRADLSYVLPVTAIGYVLNALAGRLILAEQVSATRWVGTLLIVAGSALVSRTAPRTS
jgi:uncharacterized membrane protein